MVATCVNSLCGGECQFGFHDCSGVCADDTSPQTCGSSCSPCPKPTNGFATCDQLFGCDFDCNTGFVKTATGCAVGMSLDLRATDLRATDLRSSSTDLASTDLASSTTDMTVDNRPPCDCSGLAVACTLTHICVGLNCCQECTLGLPLCGTGTCMEDPTCKPSTF
jgi:hypothetical protein